MLLADLVDLRGQEVAKNLTFKMGQGPPALDYVITNASRVPPGAHLQFKANDVQYTVPVGEVVGFDLTNVDIHPFHIHINPFQLTEEQAGASDWMHEWFKSGDWHDTLFIPYRNETSNEGGGASQRVLMQTDYFTGPTVVHCHILMHEDQGMMITINFTGSEGTRYPPAYGDTETCRATPETCSTPLIVIDPKCYGGSEMVKSPNVLEGRVGKCPSPPSPNVLAFKAATATAEATAEATAVAATATAEAQTWKVTTIVLGVVLTAVLLLVAAVFLLTMRGTANMSGATASGAEASGAEMM